MGPDVFGNCGRHTRTKAIVSPSSACTQVTWRSCSDPDSDPSSLGLRVCISNGPWACPGCWPKDHTLRSKDLEGTYTRIKTNMIVFPAPLLFKSPDFLNLTHILITSLLHNNTVNLKKKKERKRRGEDASSLLVKYHSILFIVISPMEIKYDIAFKYYIYTSCIFLPQLLVSIINCK